MDAGNFALISQICQQLGALTQHLGAGGDARGDNGGGAVTAMLKHGGHGLLAGGGVGERLSAAAVTVHVDQARQQVAALGSRAGLLKFAGKTGSCGLLSFPHPQQV